MFEKLSVSNWEDEIYQGLEYRRIYGLESKWKDIEAMFYSVHPSSVHDGPNLISSNGDAILSDLCVPFPMVLLKSLRGLNAAARLLETVDNALIRSMNIQDEMEIATLSSFLWGVGILKGGYDSEWGFDPRFLFEGDKSLGLTTTQFNKKGDRIEFGQAKPGQPWIKAVMPHDIVVPWGTRRLSNSPWVAHRVIRHIEDIKADPKYENKKNLEPSMSMKDFVRSYQSIGNQTWRLGDQNRDHREGEAEFVELWEIHDARTDRILVIASGYNKFLRNELDLLMFNRQPFFDFSLTPRARSFWTTSDAYRLIPFQTEISDISIQCSKQRRLGVVKFLYDKQMIDQDELDKAMSAEVGVGISIKAGNRGLQEGIQVFAPANNNILLQQDGEYVRKSARETVGLSRNQVGEFEQSGRRTATEANIVQEGSGQRTGRKMGKIAQVYTEMIGWVNEVIFSFWKSPRWIEVLGKEGSQTIEFVGTELKGEYAIQMYFSQDPGQTLQSRVSQAMGLFQGLVNDPAVDHMQLIEYLKQSFNNPEITKVLSPPQQSAPSSVSVPQGPPQGPPVSKVGPQGSKGGV